ncbi:MAG TPA: TetR/AcrR family transcriptional regulator [Mycobacterium sp.]|nr:TetR/AcrR family transcriptional regulator [Mycobacterium sp.]
MARQVRSQVTRRKLLDAAIDVFSEVGPTAAARIAITERAGMTKGALYYHFDSMESLLSAIIDEGSATVLNSFQAMCAPPSPALEGMIHGMFAVDDVLASDKHARVAEHLVFALSGFNDSAAAVYSRWLTEVAAQTKRAVVEGDVREDLNPDTVSESIVGAMFGTRLLPQETPQGDLPGRLTRMWDLLLPAVATDTSLPYFREFLARETLRYQSSRIPG